MITCIIYKQNKSIFFLRKSLFPTLLPVLAPSLKAFPPLPPKGPIFPATINKVVKYLNNLANTYLWTLLVDKRDRKKEERNLLLD